MVDVLTVTPFGAIFEIHTQSPYFCANGEYEIFLNERFYAKSAKNVVSLLGLVPDTYYDVMIKGYFCDDDIHFSFETKRPDYIVNVKEYGAKGDGITSDTAAINLAIYTAPKNSTVYVPKGTYLVHQILLKSGVDIYLEKGATILQSTNRTELAIIKGYERSYDHIDAEINSTWEGHPLDSYASLIYGKSVTDVHIYGEGKLDGNGEASGFWNNPGAKNIAYRPKNILLVDCVNVQISSLCSTNSASWNIHLHGCDDVSLKALTILSRESSPNTDGISPESCHSVEIVGCYFSVGDDCIAIRAGKYYMSLKHRKPTRAVTIRNCLMENGEGAVTIGSEMSSGVYGVDVSQCLMKNTRRGLRIKTRRGRGEHGVVDGVTFQNVVMKGVSHCFVVNMFYNCDQDGKSDYVKDKNPRTFDEFTPSVKNIWLVKVRAIDIRGTAMFVYGLPESNVSQILVRESCFKFAKERINECPDMMDDFEPIDDLGIFIENASEVIMADNKVKGRCVSHANTRVRGWPSGEYYTEGVGLEYGISFEG